MKATKWGGLVLALVLALALIWGLRQRAPAPASPAPAPGAQSDHIEVASTDLLILQEQTLSEGVPVSGSLKAVQSAWVKARVAGELQDFRVREGDSVKAGQVLGRIDPTEYERRWRQAQEQAQAAKAQVEIAQKQYDNNSALVQQGFISKTALDTSLFSLQSAQATLRAAQAGADVAQKALDDWCCARPCRVRSPAGGRKTASGWRLTPRWLR